MTTWFDLPSEKNGSAIFVDWQSRLEKIGTPRRPTASRQQQLKIPIYQIIYLHGSLLVRDNWASDEIERKIILLQLISLVLALFPLFGRHVRTACTLHTNHSFIFLHFMALNVIIFYLLPSRNCLIPFTHPHFPFYPYPYPSMPSLPSSLQLSP